MLIERRSSGFHIPIMAIALAAMALAIACESQQPAPKTAVPGPVDSLAVVEVIDGDTFLLGNGKAVRIAMIDTPEKNELLYHEASQYVKSLLLNHRVRLVPVGAGQDRYGRLLAEVYFDSLNIGLEVLRAGLGIIYIYSDNKYMLSQYLPAQIKAIEEKRGLWALPGPVREDYYINMRGSYRFHRPLCPHLKEVNPENIIKYESRLEALKRGLSPCRTCKP